MSANKRHDELVEALVAAAQFILFEMPSERGAAVVEQLRDAIVTIEASLTNEAAPAAWTPAREQQVRGAMQAAIDFVLSLDDEGTALVRNSVAKRLRRGLDLVPAGAVAE